MQGVLVLRWAENGICKLQHVLPSLLQHGRPDFGYNKKVLFDHSSIAVAKPAMSDLTNCVCGPPPRTAFISASAFSGVQATACGLPPELRTTSVRRRTCDGYVAPIAGPWLAAVPHGPAIGCCALCAAVGVAAV